MKAKHTEREVGRKRPIGLLPQLCESGVGLQGWLTEQDGPVCTPYPKHTLITAEEEEEALIRQRTHTALDMPISTVFKSSIPSMN